MVALLACLGLLTCGLPPIHAAKEPRKVDGKTLAEWERVVWEQERPPHRAVRALGEMGEAAIPALIRLMREHPRGDIRYLSQEALAQIGEAAVEPMKHVLKDGDRSAKMAAILGLEKVLGEKAAGILEPMLEDPSRSVIARAAGALVRITGDSETYLPPLVNALRTGSRGDRWVAAESLGWCGEKAAEATDDLIAALSLAEPSVRQQIIMALGRIGTKDAREALAVEHAKELDSEDKWERIGAAYKLGSEPDAAEGALPQLRERLSDRNEDVIVRGYCAWAIDRMDPEGRPAQPRTFHVDNGAENASDDNSGTRDEPWRTIQQAAEEMYAGDTVVIHEGVYRECVRPFRGGDSFERMVTYRAAPGAKVVIKGSDIWEPDWEEEHVGDASVWSADWQRLPWDHPENWPEPNEGPTHRAEQIFVDGELMTHVAETDELGETAGAFSTDDEKGRLLVRLPDDSEPGDHVIERSVRQQLFAPAVRGLGYIRVQGLQLTHAANPESNGSNWGVIGHRAALSTRGGHHWIIEDNEITWANAQGMDIGGEGFSEDLQKQPCVSDEVGYHHIRRNTVSYNGVAGIVGWGGGENYLLLEDNVTNYNCRKGNFYAYEAAGVKLHNANHVICRRHRSHGNEAFGIWFDHKCHHNRITQCTVTDNRGAGIFVEVSSQGPNLVDSNVVIGTRDASRGGWADGLYSHDADEVTWANNIVLDNDGWGARIRYLVGREAGWGPTTAIDNRVFNNIFSGNGRGVVNFQPETDRSKGNVSDFNVISDADGEPTFFLDNGGINRKWESAEFGKQFDFEGTGSLELSLEQWRAYGNDNGSIVADVEELLGDIGTEIQADEPAAELLKILRGLWEQDFGLDDGYGEYEAVEAEGIVEGLEEG